MEINTLTASWREVQLNFDLFENDWVKLTVWKFSVYHLVTVLLRHFLSSLAYEHQFFVVFDFSEVW